MQTNTYTTTNKRWEKTLHRQRNCYGNTKTLSFIVKGLRISHSHHNWWAKKGTALRLVKTLRELLRWHPCKFGNKQTMGEDFAQSRNLLWQNKTPLLYCKRLWISHSHHNWRVKVLIRSSWNFDRAPELGFNDDILANTNWHRCSNTNNNERTNEQTKLESEEDLTASQLAKLWQSS